jgi:hypothetical protein
MNRFVIESNRFLSQNIQAFYHTDFYGYGKPNNPDYLNILKNDNHQNWSPFKLNSAANLLGDILAVDLPQLLQLLQLNTLTVCVIPRAKADITYRANQLLFKSTVQDVVNHLNGFEDGTNYISRHTNTRTTHLRRPIEGYVNDGQLPYPGITTDTCNISNNVRGRDILLIDDIYTKTVNLDEDAIQALLNKGARSVTFYAVGQTVGNYL